MKFVFSNAKRSKSWGSAADGLKEATTAFTSNYNTSIFKHLHFFVILILGLLQNRESKEKQNAGVLRKHDHSVTT